MNPYHFRVSLRLQHPTRHLSFASAQFGLTPRRQWVAGAPRTTPSGDPLEGNNDRSYWIAPLLGGMTHSVDQTLEEAISKVLEELLPHREFFSGLRNDGGSVYLFVGLFGPDNFGIEFDAELIRQLGELGMELGFDIYPGRPSD